MKIVKLDRRYTQCRLNNYWIALHFDEEYDSKPNWGQPFWIKRKLVDHYGPGGYAVCNNPSPWYNEYVGNYLEIIYLRDESMLTFLELSGAFFDENN